VTELAYQVFFRVRLVNVNRFIYLPVPQLPGSILAAGESTLAAMEALRNNVQQLEKEFATQRQMELIQRRFSQQEVDRRMDQMR
jgi:hypothetical protein